MKRKIIAIFLIGIMCLSLSGCEKTPIKEVPTTTSTQKVVAYSPAARGFDSLEEFKTALASMQSSAKSQNQAFGLDEIWVPANLPASVEIANIAISQSSYLVSYNFKDEIDKDDRISLVVYFATYYDDGEKNVFDNKKLKVMADHMKCKKYEGAENVYYLSSDKDYVEVGKVYFYAYKDARIQLTIPNTVFDEIIELGLDPFLLKVI